MVKLLTQSLRTSKLDWSPNDKADRRRKKKLLYRGERTLFFSSGYLMSCIEPPPLKNRHPPDPQSPARRSDEAKTVLFFSLARPHPGKS